MTRASQSSRSYAVIQKRPYGSKALINACKEHRHLPPFSKRVCIDDVAFTILGDPLIRPSPIAVK